MRYSMQREIILNCVKDNALHLTADGVYELIKKNAPNISLGTVYRNLAQLVENDLLLKISIPGQPERYDGNLTPHIHFLCTKCNKVCDIFDNNILIVEKIIKDHLNSQVDTFEVSAKGLCNECN